MHVVYWLGRLVLAKRGDLDDKIRAKARETDEAKVNSDRILILVMCNI